MVSKTWVWAAVPHCWSGGLRFLKLQRPPSNKHPVGNTSSLIFHYLWETPAFFYTQAAEGCSRHGGGVLGAGATLNILASCGGSDKSQSRMVDEKASWRYVNVPDVRLVHANIWYIDLPCILVLCVLGMKVVMLADINISCLAYVGGPIHALHVFRSSCAGYICWLPHVYLVICFLHLGSCQIFSLWGSKKSR